MTRRIFVLVALFLPAAMAQLDASPIVSTNSAFAFNVQFFLLSAFLLLAAWLMYLYYHANEEHKIVPARKMVKKAPLKSRKTPA